MDFVALENKGKKLLEQFPFIKRSFKRVYQLSMYAISKEKIKVDGEVIKVSPEDGYEYFYGYYDKSPWDKTDRYMICLRVKQAYKSVAPKEEAEIVIIDTKNNNKVIKIARTSAWNVQQGCMAQWLGPDYSERIIYNDFRSGKHCSVIFNVKLNKEEKILSLPIYDISKDGKFALSLDFSRLHRLRKGYGYSNIPDKTKDELCPNKTCIWKINIDTNEVEELFKYTDFAEFEPKETMVGAEHKVNHIMISPNGKRFMVLHRWFKNGRKNTRLVTVNCDGTDMYNLSDDVFVSHCYWKNDEEILSFLRKKETGDHYYLMKDKTEHYEMFWPELNTDGHCSYSPDKKLIITDTYPNRKRLAYVFVCKENGEAKRIASVFAPFRYDNDVRCDLHPRWSNNGDMVCIDSVHNGKRGLYVIQINEEEKKIITNQRIPKIIHSIWIGNGKKSKIMEKSMESWKKFCPDYQIMEWNESNFDIENSCSYVREAYQEKKWAFVSDYIRLKVLYEYGGIYLDTDMEILRNIDKFLTNDGFLCTESHHTVSTALLAAKPRADWVKDLLEEYEILKFINPDGTYNKLPNTKRVQKYLEEKYKYSWSNEAQELVSGLVIYPSEYFSPLNCFTGVLSMSDHTYSIHHYDNTWKSKKDKIKKKIMQIGTRIIGEDNRARLVGLKNGKTK